MFSRRASIALLGLCALSLAGCSNDALKSSTALKMSGLANAYLDHVANTGPK